MGVGCKPVPGKQNKQKRRKMPNVKLTYFDLRARAELCRLLLAYGGIKYEDERIPPPWDPATTWSTLKPTTPFGQLPILRWDNEELCQSMACARFIAREVGLAGNSNMSQLRWMKSLMLFKI